MTEDLACVATKDLITELMNRTKACVVIGLMPVRGKQGVVPFGGWTGSPFECHGLATHMLGMIEEAIEEPSSWDALPDDLRKDFEEDLSVPDEEEDDSNTGFNFGN